MRNAIALAALLFAGSAFAADPVYIDQLMEQPLPALQQQFPGLKKEGCYRVGTDRFLLIDVEKKEQKPWRVVLTGSAPCRHPEDAALMDVRQRHGVQLGMSTTALVAAMGRPEASAAPEATLKKLGDLEYFYLCRISEGCARHTSVFVREGVVTAVAEWYSR
ncbi:MAG TPA: hypothetical protein VND45_10870 [Thermoanaerobaculia bacterium]|jgi:hypothetical protein|nr:hypothetical protein [Thermoanaerobaculia bacterium]